MVCQAIGLAAGSAAQDYIQLHPWDYIIGSVHYLDGEYKGENLRFKRLGLHYNGFSISKS